MASKFPIAFLLIAFTALLSLSCSESNHESEGQDAPEGNRVTEQKHERGFDELSSEYYESETRVIWQKPKLVIDLMGNLEGRTVADIGAGTGYFAFRIASAGANVIAIDIDPRAIEFMESEKLRYPESIGKRFSTRLATGADAGLKEAEVDVVLLVNTYIYINNRVEYFRNLRNGLKPGGKVIIVDFKDEKTTIGPELSERIGLTQVQRELTEAGYAIESADVEMLEYQYIVTALVP